MLPKKLRMIASLTFRGLASMAQANMLTAELLSTIGNEASYHRRVKVYTVGGTQIGLPGLGQGGNALSAVLSY